MMIRTVLHLAPEQSSRLLGYQVPICQAFQSLENPAVLAYSIISNQLNSLSCSAVPIWIWTPLVVLCHGVALSVEYR